MTSPALDDRSSAHPINLAAEPAFFLGAAEIHPATLEFAHSGRRQDLQPRIMQVLVALAKRRGEVVSRDELMAAGWGQDVVGEDALHRCIVRIRKLAVESGAFTITAIPRVGYRLTEQAAGVRRPPTVPRPRVWAALAGVTIAAILGFVGWLRIDRAQAGPPVIAIGTFEAAGDDPVLKALGQSVAHQTIGSIDGQLPRLSTTDDPRRANVSVSGLVSRSAKGFTATLHITDPRARTTLWSGEVSGPAASLPDQAAALIADRLNCGAPGLEPSLKLDQESRALWFQTCNFIAGDPTRIDAQKAAAERLVQRAPRFADAFAQLSIMKTRWSQGQSAEEAALARADARAKAERALELDPGLGRAYVARSMAAPWSSWTEQETWLRRGLAVAPDHPFLHARLCLMLYNVGRVEEARRHCNRANQLAPFAARIVPTGVYIDHATGHVDEAQRAIERGERLWPENPDVAGMRLRVALENDPARALAILADDRGRPPGLSDTQIAALRTYAAFRIGAGGTRAEAVKAVSVELQRSSFPFPEDAQALFTALLTLGETRSVLELVQARANTHQGVSPWVLFKPQAAAARGDVAFMPLAARLGLLDYWRESGRWPDFCTGRDREFDCQAAAAKAGV